MKKKLLLFIVAALSMIVVTTFADDGWIYSVAALIAIIMVVAIRSFNSKGGIKITRWAKENPRKTQVLIGVLQILIVSAALLIGYDLKELGYKLSEGPVMIFGVILVSAFFTIRFFPKQNIIAIPAAVTKDRIAYMCIALSAFVIMVITGNRIEDKFPGSPINLALKSIDHSIFPQDNFSNEEKNIAVGMNTNEGQMLMNEKSSMLALASISGTDESSATHKILPKKEAREKIKAAKKAEKLEKKKQKMMKRIERLRKMVGAGATIGTILLIILLIITSCAGICLIAIGGSAGAVILGIVLLAGSVWGFVKIFQKKKRIKEG